MELQLLGAPDEHTDDGTQHAASTLADWVWMLVICASYARTLNSESALSVVLFFRVCASRLAYEMDFVPLPLAVAVWLHAPSSLFQCTRQTVS